MTNPLHAKYYADGAVQRTVPIVENVLIARNTYRLRFECPVMAERFLPGQFLMLRLSARDDPLLGRALALYDTVRATDGSSVGIDVVYLVMGKMTSRLATCLPGQSVDVWGPLGNGFCPRSTEHLIVVAGGIGYTPFPAVVQEYLGSAMYGAPARQISPVSRVTMCYGARSADLLAGLDDFRRIGVDLHIATDDGTRGHHGLVTDLLAQVLDERFGACHIVSCGPEPMMEAVSDIATERNLTCEVSLETPMACGIGVCFSCVAKVCDARGDWDYKRTCVEGPVFDATALQW